MTDAPPFDAACQRRLIEAVGAATLAGDPLGLVFDDECVATRTDLRAALAHIERQDTIITRLREQLAVRTEALDRGFTMAVDAELEVRSLTVAPYVEHAKQLEATVEAQAREIERLKRQILADGIVFVQRAKQAEDLAKRALDLLTESTGWHEGPEWHEAKLTLLASPEARTLRGA